MPIAPIHPNQIKSVANVLNKIHLIEKPFPFLERADLMGFVEELFGFLLKSWDTPWIKVAKLSLENQEEEDFFL